MGRNTQEVLVARLAAFERELTDLRQRVIDLERKGAKPAAPGRRWPADGPPVPAATKGYLAFGIFDRGKQHEFTCNSPIINVGSGKSCTLLLEDDQVSRVHAVIERDAEVTLIDTGSENGTYVNDLRVKKAVLKSGDLLRFGGAQVIVVF